MSRSNSCAITSVEGNRQLLDGGAMFGNAPRAVWERWIKPDDVGRIPLACRCLLIECDGRLILCETGIGAFFEPRLAARFGVQSPDRHLLLENLAALGVAPEHIDYVVLSHLHFDHAGGLLPTYAEIAAGNDELVFPRAEILVGRAAWDRAVTPHARDRASFIPGLTDKLARSGRLRILDQGAAPSGSKNLGELSDRLELIVTEGHTPGQIHLLFRGDAGSVFYGGDLVPGVPWVHVPITMGYDRNPELLIDEKSAIFDRAAREDWLMFFTHDPTSAAAHLVKGANGAFTTRDVQEKFVRRPL